MRKFFSLVFIILLMSASLLNAQWQWLPKVKRLNTGSMLGSSTSYDPQVSRFGDHVYVVWCDTRNGTGDIYFNYSHDGGATWQIPDIRLDRGDPSGNSDSWKPQISRYGDHVYVVWQDFRNGRSDIYFNYSHDSGATWQDSDIRLDMVSLPYVSISQYPQISSFGDHVYVVWYDTRSSPDYIYFNYSHDWGVNWQTSDICLDSGGLPGYSNYPQISSYGDNVYIVWYDTRNGYSDIYFNYSHDGGVTWQNPGIRLDLGSLPGIANSYYPQISSSGDHVYVVWSDGRDYWEDIYFNYSHDGGVTWQASDIRLDTGSLLGRAASFNQQISSFGNNVYVVWEDARNGVNRDIYFNFSQDNGMTWQASDIRLDTGDLPGSSSSSYPQISSSGDHVYVVWQDSRNGYTYDLYFNYSHDGGTTWLPSDIRVNLNYDYHGIFRSAKWAQITCSNNRVFTVWVDAWMGEDDIYFNTTNQSPQVHLGENLSATKGESLILDGSSSFDPEDDRLTYNWRVLSAPEGSHASFSDDRLVSPTFTANKVGTYELRLVATDAFGADGYDKIKVKVIPPARMLRLKSGKGGTTLPAPGVYSHTHGSKVTIQAIPKAGYVFSHWSGDASGKRNPKNITLYRDKKIKAHFIRQ